VFSSDYRNDAAMSTANRTGCCSEHNPMSPRPAILLPGSGSDEVFVTAAFARPLAALGFRLVAPRPTPGVSVVSGYVEALDQGVGAGVVVGGVSLGAQVAARWAADRIARGLPGPAALLLALPAWTGEPGDAPAAVAARASSATLRRNGLIATLSDARANTPEWLGSELARAWTRHGEALADSLETTACTSGPTPEQLGALRVPVGVVGLLDDPVHPIEVALRWQALLPRAALVTTTLTAMGRDPETLGRAAALAWSRAILLDAPNA
jgi:pimeloyl-ACP methyl ester carboxylesterase